MIKKLTLNWLKPDNNRNCEKKAQEVIARHKKSSSQLQEELEKLLSQLKEETNV